MLLFLLACQVPEGATELDSVEDPDAVEDLGCVHEPHELDIDPAKACGDGDELLLESGYDGPGTHFDWTVEECFLAAGGSVPDVDAPSVVVQCPRCRVSGTQIYETRFEVTDDEGDPVGWGYGHIAQVCPND